jgi:hypothetical protein
VVASPAQACVDVHEMQAPCLLVMLARSTPVGIPVAICPGGFARDVMRRQIVGICREHCPDIFANGGFEKSLGDQGNDPMALIAPRQSGLQKQANRCRQGDGRSSLERSPQESLEDVDHRLY